jgi:hypothetical protein
MILTTRLYVSGTAFWLAASREKIVLVADIDVSEDIPESEFEKIAKDLEAGCKEEIPNIEYCQFYITPKYAY